MGKKKLQVDIGLDISTSITGVSVLDRQGSVIDMIPITYKSTMSFWDKSDHSKEVFEGLSRQYDVQRVFVEENLQKFRPGFSSASTLTTLSKFNGILSYIARQVFSVDPVNISVSEARKSIGLKLKRGEDTKMQVLEHVSEMIDWDYPIREITRGKKKGQMEPAKGVFDMADSFVICKAGQNLYS